MKKKKITQKEKKLRQKAEQQSIQQLIDKRYEVMGKVEVLPTPEFLTKHEVVEKETKRAGEKLLYVTDQLWIDTYLRRVLSVMISIRLLRGYWVYIWLQGEIRGLQRHYRIGWAVLV